MRGRPAVPAVAAALWRMARPSQVALIALVYALGVSMAAARGAELDVARVAFGLAALIPVAVSVHYANEYADVGTDRLTDRTPFSGGSGALVDTDISPQIALHAALAAGIVGIALIVIGVSSLGGELVATTPAVLLGLVLLLGWQYSVGPLRLAWKGLGEVTNAALGGVVLPVYGFAVVTGDVTLRAVLATVPFALVVFVNLLETTWPDRRADAAVGKRTLATRWSPGRLRFVYGVVGLAALGTGIALSTPRPGGPVLPRPVAVATLAPMIGLAYGWSRFTRRETPFPAVVTMVAIAAAATLGWLVVADIEIATLTGWVRGSEG